MEKRILIAFLMLVMLMPAIGSMAQGRDHKKPRIEVVEEAKPEFVNKLPREAEELKSKSGEYFRAQSKFYKFDGRRYKVVVPPAGLRVNRIARGAEQFKFKGATYFNDNGIVFKKAGDGFIVVEPEKGMVLSSLPDINMTILRIDGERYFECGDVIYEKLKGREGARYEVYGRR